MQESYEVLRLIPQNAGCHIVMDYVQGKLFGYYLMNNPEISKEQLFTWFYQLIQEIECLEHARSDWPLDLITPFSIVLKKDGTLAFLNLKAKTNQKIVSRIRKQHILELFAAGPGYSPYFSLGKTIQFVMAKTSVVPKLSRKEERRIQRVISKCLSDNIRKQYQSCLEIKSHFIPRKKKKVRILLFLSMPLLLGGVLTQKKEELFSNKMEEVSYRETPGVRESESEEYLRQLEQYEKEMSEEHKEEVYVKVAKMYEELRQEDRARYVCESGFLYHPKSIDLAILYVRLICRQSHVSKEKREEMIAGLGRMNEELFENPRFWMLQREFGIQVEGEKVWLEE